MNREYKKVTGWWVYGHITPNGKIYIGCSGQEISSRWQSSHYKNTTLENYIEKYGWDNIKHIVFKDGLTQKQAEQLEDLLIIQARIDNWCINKLNSGGEWRDNRKEYDKNYRQQPHIKNYIKNFHKKYYSTPEGKIYNRVNTFNYFHPDRKIETPLEAKQKYLETGYIPSYIKNNDLI